MEITFNMKGFDQLKRQFRRMSPRDSSRIAKIATRAAAKPLLREMRGRVPRRTGTLYKSLGLVNVKRSTPGAWLKVGARSGKRLKNDGWYAHMVEFPTRARGNHPGTKAQPFIRPAVDAIGDKVIEDLGAQLGIAIEKFY